MDFEARFPTGYAGGSSPAMVPFDASPLYLELLKAVWVNAWYTLALPDGSIAGDGRPL